MTATRRSVVEVAFSALVLSLGAVVGLSFFVGPLRALLHPLLELYLLSLEIFFRAAESNEAILAVSGGVLLLGLLHRPLIGRLPGAAQAVARAAVEGFLALLAMLAQIYVLAFAAITQPVHLGVVLVVGVAAGVLWRRRMKSPGEADRGGPTLTRVPLTVLLSFLVIYFFLGMIQGHLATPLVHGLSALFAHLSAEAPVLFRLLAVLALALPLLPWLPGLIRALPSGRRWTVAGVVAGIIVVLCVLPGGLAVHGAGVLLAATLAAAMASAGFGPVAWLHPDPRRLVARVLLLALLGVNTAAVHYLGTMWECAHAGAPHPAVRRVSPEAGAFSLATSSDGLRLLASLREPRRVVSVDLARGKTSDLLDLSGGQGTGHLFSWHEPENLLLLDGGRFLMLRAVSDDQERNAVAVLDAGGRFQQYLSRPRAGVSDMVTGPRGKVYLSTEFQGQVFVLDPRTLELLDTVRWPGAETNRVLVTPDRRMFSLGLWSDPMLRVMDLGTKRQTAALDVGTLSWDMAHDPRTRRIFVPKFMTGQVLVIDDRTLTVKQRWPAGFGARAVRLDAEQRLLYVGAMYDGTVTVLDADSGRRLLRLRLGGHIKGLHLESRTHKVYVGCDCGIFEIDGKKLKR